MVSANHEDVNASVIEFSDFPGEKNPFGVCGKNSVVDVSTDQEKVGFVFKGIVYNCREVPLKVLSSLYGVGIV